MSALAAILLDLLIALSAGASAPGDAAPGVAVASERPPVNIHWVSIPRGRYSPLFPPSPGETSVDVGAFSLARTPVTNREYLSFVGRHPEWRRDRVQALFADEHYLAHWTSPDAFAAGTGDRAVTDVSWFAARAFCDDVGGRLPTEAEWERAAAASRTAEDGRKDPAWSRAILDWYAAPSKGSDRDVGQEPPNFWGVQNLSGLVWEWVVDFNAVFVTSDSRNPRTTDPLKFCGGGALGAQDPENYAAFMRIAFLSSLEARFAAQHLGFRCARDARKDGP